jgi:protein-tyrosine phosphatase
VLYRSAAPTDEAARESLAALGITTVFDLRTLAERDQRPVLLPGSTQHVVADVLRDSPDSGAANLGSMAADAMRGTASTLTAVDVRAVMISSYRSFPTLPSAVAATADFLTHLVAEGTGPSLFHCTAGKDRTGWLAAVTLSAVGVPRDDILADYLASGPELARLLAPVLDAVAAKGRDLSAFAPALGVEEAYLDAAWAAMDDAYGSLTGYLTSGLGLPANYPDQLRSRLLEG